MMTLEEQNKIRKLAGMELLTEVSDSAKKAGGSYTVYDPATNKIVKPNLTRMAAKKMVDMNSSYKYGSAAWVHDNIK